MNLFSKHQNKRSTIQWLAYALVCLFLLGCSTRPPLPPATPPIDEPNIPLGFTPKFYEYDGLQTTVWSEYGKGLYYCAKEHPALSFEREVCARSRSVEAFENNAKGYQYKYKSLREQAKAARAGFIREYTWYYLQKPYWVKPQSLSLGKFETWKQMGLPGHEPNKEPGIFLKQELQLTTHTSTLASIQPEIGKTLSYPNKINEFTFKGLTEYEHSSLGEKVRYIDDHIDMEAYVYPLPSPYEKLSSPSFVRGVFSGEKAEILKLEENDRYNEVKVLYEGMINNEITNTTFQQGIYALRNYFNREYRFVYMSAYKGQLIKIVFNQPVGHHFDGPSNFNNDALAFLVWAKTKIDFLESTDNELQAPATLDLSASVENPIHH